MSKKLSVTEKKDSLTAAPVWNKATVQEEFIEMKFSLLLVL